MQSFVVETETDAITKADTTPSLRTIERWANEFKRGRQSLEDDARSGRPATSTNPEQVQAVEALVVADRRIRVAQIEHELGISHGSVLEILHEHLGFSKVSAIWVPKFLNRDNKQNRVDCSLELMNRYDADPVQFLRPLITGMSAGYITTILKRNPNQWRGDGRASERRESARHANLPASKWEFYSGMPMVWFMLNICRTVLPSLANIMRMSSNVFVHPSWSTGAGKSPVEFCFCKTTLPGIVHSCCQRCDAMWLRNTITSPVLALPRPLRFLPLSTAEETFTWQAFSVKH